MAETIFACPNCQQDIACDDSYAGQQLQCPLCQAVITMPATQAARNPLVPKPPPGKQASLSIGASRQESSSHNAQRQVPIRTLTAPIEKKSKLKTWLPVIIGVVVVGAGVYFGWPYLRKWQDKTNEARQKEEKNSDGGQVGHINELHSVLDATEPGGSMMTGSDAAASAPRQRQGGANRAVTVAEGGVDAGGADGTAPAATNNLKVIPPIYAMSLDLAKIPEGRLCGTISGTNFVADLVRIDAVSGSQVLRMMQGNPVSPDREILIYLKLKAGETLTNRVCAISSDMRTAVPTVVKRWKPNPKYAAQQRPFNYGYTMKLQLGNMDENGQLDGKIFLALPDPEQSVVAGIFKTTTSSQDPSMLSAPAQAAPAPGPSNLSPAERANFQKRYGIAPK
jgi:hypothetical protein